jgi:hypothetical protein
LRKIAEIRGHLPNTNLGRPFGPGPGGWVGRKVVVGWSVGARLVVTGGAVGVVGCVAVVSGVGGLSIRQFFGGKIPDNEILDLVLPGLGRLPQSTWSSKLQIPSWSSNMVPGSADILPCSTPIRHLRRSTHGKVCR